MSQSKALIEEAVELENLYRSKKLWRPTGARGVFGGQVVGQSLMAANNTVPPQYSVHSLHSYFLLPGDIERPLLYRVDRVRDGRSYCTRTVHAIQGGRSIFVCEVSFHVKETSLLEHQYPMPITLGPESLPTRDELVQGILNDPKVTPDISNTIRFHIFEPFDLEIRFTEPIDVGIIKQAVPMPPRQSFWIRVSHRLPDDPRLHEAIAAYATDHLLLSTAMRPMGLHMWNPRVSFMTTLDHCIWFHSPFRVDEWLYYEMESPRATSGRGFSLGRLYDPNGTLVLSCAQEGAIRIKKILPKPDDRKQSYSFNTSSGSIPTMNIEEHSQPSPRPSASRSKSKFAPQYTGCRYDISKPPYSYASLIAQALLAAPDKRLTLNQIYQWIMDKYPYYRSENSGWQNSIRHNLSLNSCFRKLAKSERDTGKGSHWTLNEEELAAFKDGAFKRRKLAPGSSQHGRRRRRREAQLQMQLNQVYGAPLVPSEPILPSICDWEATPSVIVTSTMDTPLFDWDGLAAKVRAQCANAGGITIEEIYRASSPSNLPAIREVGRLLEVEYAPTLGQAGLTFNTWELQQSAAEVRTDYTDPLEILNK